jgi:2-polyprenyl-6-methoxyphenol hydroxylase-like FAD-dependent oxidoreductase
LQHTEVYDVVIVGAGPVGLAVAIELGSRGVRCLVVERNARVGYAPRAKTTNVRTRTHLRRWGIADQLAAASPFGVDYPSNVVFTTRLSGVELARFANAFNTAPARNPFYPEHAQWIPQYKLEEVLRSHVATLPAVTVRFSMELESFTQNKAHVDARFRSVAGSEGFLARARFLVGADGYYYQRSRVIANEDAEVTIDPGHYEPSSRPGCLAPHMWLSDGSSLSDSFGPGYTLLSRRPEPTAEAAQQAYALSIPLTVATLSDDESRSLYPRALTLVRPDQHVCWRGYTWDPNVLRMVSGQSSVPDTASQTSASPLNLSL